MTTVDAIVKQTREKLRGITGRDRLVLLATAVNDSTTTWAVSPGTDLALKAGTILACEYERGLIVSFSNPNVTIARAYGTSAAAAHAQFSAVEIEPRFPADVVLLELINELRSWPRDLYATTTVDLSFGAGDNLVDLTGSGSVEVYRILNATIVSSISGKARLTKPKVTLHRNMGSAYASGNAVAVGPTWAFGQAVTVRVTYAHSLATTTITSTTDLESTVGLQRSMLDILPYGIGIRLMLNKEAQRDDLGAQGQQRVPSEVPPMSWAKTAQLWQQMRDARISQERTRLLELHGWSQS